MVLHDITNGRQKAYEYRLVLDPKYTPLVTKGGQENPHVQRLSFPAKRNEAATHIDLWLDGSLYPKDPLTGQSPSFKNIKELVSYVGEGKNGLLGYTERLAQISTAYMQSALFDKTHHALIVQKLQEELSISHATNAILERRMNDSGDLQARIAILSDSCIHKSQVLEEKTMAMKEMKKSLNKELKAERKMSAKWKEKFHERTQRVKDLGGHLYKRKDISDLVPTGGHAKRLRRQMRVFAQPATSLKIIEEGQRLGKARQRLLGNELDQANKTSVISSLLTGKEKITLVDQPSMGKAVVHATNKIYEKMEGNGQTQRILAACDKSGVSQKGYAEIRKGVKNRLREINPNLKLTLLPNAHRIALLRKALNANLCNYIGEYYHLDLVLPIDTSVKCKKQALPLAQPRNITLSDKNSIFADLEAVQRSMVKFYKITKNEIGEGPLLFVLKLDEAEIVKGQKLERVSITLMNRALNPEISKEDARYFSVQSDQEIWPVAAFEVTKESYMQLKLILNATKFPSTIEAQESGKLLEVPNVGAFKVEWHLAADMKTIKCMYGFKLGANAIHSCIYCLQEKATKKLIHSEEEMIRINKKRQQPSWVGGLFNTRHGAQPSRDTIRDPDCMPILLIPLVRVHICTLHGNVRIVEKILHLHFMWVWNMKDKNKQKVAIEDMENTLSAAGVHGGKVRIFEDPKLSGTTSSVPSRPSMNGVHVTRMFKKSQCTDKSKVWMDVVEAEHHVDPELKHQRMIMWKKYEGLQSYLTGVTQLSTTERGAFKEKMEEWGRIFLKCFGENQVTHYIHVFVKHAAWFVDVYGSLSIWSTQGMEKSHSAAKHAYNRHTQHCGTNLRTSPLLQMTQHFYRNVQHREAESTSADYMEALEEQIGMPTIDILAQEIVEE